ncbi:hypothetical protein QYF61_027650 [Mycteria americana]|uniref:Reverse transcriptase domain-containing protein n=1 Tax=Mycteria americana TaxID=33587 RepID=A0AAN7NGE4_MYCAM|nr:hypothetical protein QYF61_027650 [Mycteria americana]
MLDNPFSEESFPNTQCKPPLVQLEAISSCPMACYLGEETDPHLTTTSFQVVVESSKVSPQPPLLQAKQPQLPQPLLIRLVLQTLHQLRCPSLDTLQHLNVSLVVRGPKLNTVVEGKSYLTNLIVFYSNTSGLVDKGRPVDVVYLDFSKAFNTILHNILIDQPMKGGYYGQYCLTSPLMIWMMGQSVLSASLQTVQNWEE